MDDLREEFISETKESLDLIAGHLVRWEKSPDDREILDEVFRFFHTIKGNCGFLDLGRLERLAHCAEDLLADVREQKLHIDSNMVSAILDMIDHIAALVNAIETGGTIEHNSDQPLIARLKRFSLSDDQQDALPESDVSDMSGDDPEGVRKDSGPAPRTVRVSLSLLDDMMSEVSELVLARNEVMRQMSGIPAKPLSLDQSFARLSSTIGELRNSVGALRMQPIERLFAFLPRLVRDMSHKLGKSVELRVQDGNVEIDREMFELLRDPLVHVIRNALDHGLESSVERSKAGKPETGIINITARQSGNQVMVTVADDGRGIDVRKLVAKALDAGIVDTSDIARMTERQKLELIMAPGLSTAGKVTDISGRGVGMDVVKNNICSIGGAIELDNDPGNGLAVTMFVPLTLTIISGLVISTAGQSFVVSQSSVEELLSAKSGNVRIESSGGEMIVVRGKRMPKVSLARVLGFEDSDNGAEDAYYVVVRPAVGRAYALGVEELGEVQDLVVRPLAPAILATGVFAGSSLPDSGKPILLLDASGLAAKANVQMDEDDQLASSDADRDSVEEAETGDAIMTFHDLHGRRRAVRLALVERVEHVRRGSIQAEGQRLYVADDDYGLLSLIGISDPEELDDSVPVLKLSDGNTRLLFAIRETLELENLPRERIRADEDGLECLILVGDRQFGLLDAYSLFQQAAPSTTNVKAKAVCFLDCEGDDEWCRTILKPMLESAGYQVSSDPTGRKLADVVISAPGREKGAEDEGRCIRLTDIRPEARACDGEIYRYARNEILAELEARTAGGKG